MCDRHALDRSGCAGEVGESCRADHQGGIDAAHVPLTIEVVEYFTVIMSSPVQNKRVIKKENSHVDRISQLILGLPKIGLFGFGGGYAMLSLIQHEGI